MKHMATYADATGQNRKNRVVCCFCIKQRRSCDAKISEVHRIEGCSGNGMNLPQQMSFEPSFRKVYPTHPICKAGSLYLLQNPLSVILCQTKFQKLHSCQKRDFVKYSTDFSKIVFLWEERAGSGQAGKKFAIRCTQAQHIVADAEAQTQYIVSSQISNKYKEIHNKNIAIHR